MSDTAPAPKIISVTQSRPPANVTKYIEYKADDGLVYSGDFTFKRLTIGDVSKVGAEIARLAGGQTVSEEVDFINTMLAHFSAGIVKAPEWWRPAELYDIGILHAVFKEFMEFERSFRATVPEQPAGNTKSS